MSGLHCCTTRNQGFGPKLSAVPVVFGTGTQHANRVAGWVATRIELLPCLSYFAVVAVVLFLSSSWLRAALHLLFGIILFVLQ